MGMDASAVIWIGVKTGQMSDHALPEEVEARLDEDGEILEGDLSFLKLTISYEAIGFGVDLFGTNWNHGAADFSPVELAAKEAELKPKVEALFKKWGVRGKVKTYITCDFA